MEYVIFFAAIGLFILLVIAKGTWDSHREEKFFIQKLYDDYGSLPKKEYKLERYIRIGSYYLKHQADGQIDDITWNDLSMDEIFKRINTSFSSTGEEYLYYTLRTPSQSQDELKHLDELANYFDKNADERVKVQFLMHKLGGTGNYSLYDYLDYLDNLGNRSNVKHFLLDACYLVFIVLSFIYASLGLAGLAILMIYNITTYFREKKEIEPYIVSFAYVMRLLNTCDKLLKLNIPACEKEWNIIKEHKAKLSRMKSGSFWVLSSTRINLSGNPLDVIMDYIRMAFHVDLIKFNSMLAELNRHLEDVDVLVEQVGRIETSIVIANYRKSLHDGWCRPQFQESGELALEDCYHPLITNPVKNSIITSRGVLLTGSNASGKSTFLKTVALNVILAETIYTCSADKYHSPYFHVYSSMSLKDDIESGESYYIVEIRSLKRILDAAGESQHKVLCFVDEVLRGTNTVERIAASAQILKSLSGSNLLCFAATHDIELTDLLQQDYENYHFEEDIRDGDVYFNYKLLNGKATTRNAIKLLEIMGYKAEIIEKASRQAQKFVETGIWELT